MCYKPFSAVQFAVRVVQFAYGPYNLRTGGTICVRLIQFAVRLIHFAVRLIHFAVRLIHFAVRLIHFAVRLVLFAVRLIHFAVRLIHFAVRPVQSPAHTEIKSCHFNKRCAFLNLPVEPWKPFSVYLFSSVALRGPTAENAAIKTRNLPKGILRINLKPSRQFYVPCSSVQTCESLN